MNDPITLVVPTRNAGALFQDALRSALPQLRREDEVWVFDNQDRPGVDQRGMGAACAVSVATRDRVHSMEGSWSAALSLGTRPWVLWLHDDDLLRPGAVETLRGAVTTGDVLAWGSHVTFDEHAPDWNFLAPPVGHERRAPERSLAEYLFSHTHVCSGTLFRRAALRAALPIPEGTGLASDVWLHQRVAAQGSTVVLKAVTVGYRDHASSTTNARGSRARWRASVCVQRTEAARLLIAQGAEVSEVARIGADRGYDVVYDTLRSLVRGRSPLAAPLAEAIEREAPAVARGMPWCRVRAGTRWGPLAMDGLRPLEWMARKLTPSS